MAAYRSLAMFSPTAEETKKKARQAMP